ncbi:MAG: hypothetical protein II832_04985 [Synergistaceae bacterium]|nr:hypothetical protein [Synergistaceae bacterium]MBQ6971505.1 hypothetical protein [Synergistaceae bacterium]
MLTRRFLASLVLLLIVCLPSYSADSTDPILKAWSHETNAQTKEGDQSIRIIATYYSNEYVEALVASEAEKNLWTADEMENYKYTLLKNLNLAESIPFHIDMYVRGIPMYAQPFDKHITMMVGGKKYSPVDYDRRFNFKILGARDGMVHFPRYDEKTGKDILAGAKDVRLIFDSAISHALSGRGDVMWVWDLTKDRGKIAGGRAADRLEADRLIKRSGKIDEERAALQKRLDELNRERDEINSRIDELQSN